MYSKRENGTFVFYLEVSCYQITEGVSRECPGGPAHPPQQGRQSVRGVRGLQVRRLPAPEGCRGGRLSDVLDQVLQCPDLRDPEPAAPVPPVLRSVGPAGEESPDGDHWLLGSLQIHRVQGQIPVKHNLLFITKSFQLAADPVISYASKAETDLTIVFGNSLLSVEEEQLAFTYTDLVAECGGTLGLFVGEDQPDWSVGIYYHFLGFNFLMVWDFVINFVVKIMSLN